MLDCCSEFASTYNVKFNPSKRKCITFSQKKNIGSPELHMNDVKLDNVQLVKHLGHIITSDLTDDKDIMHQTSMYNRNHSYGTYPIRISTDQVYIMEKIKL